MSSARPSLGLPALIFLAGSLVMLWFIILSAVTDTSPLNQTYFLRANTSGITGARPVTQWAYFRICGDSNTDCRRSWADPPLGRAWSANPSNAPPDLVGSSGGNTTSHYYFYMWRFGWVFFLITLFFEIIAFFAGFVGCCGRLGAGISGLVSATALFFSTISVSLMTAVFVKARNAFLSADRDASLGRYAFGFAWGSWAALFIATVLFCLGVRGRKDVPHGGGRRRRGWTSRFRRRRSVRSRQSHDAGSRRVKDEYP